VKEDEASFNASMILRGRPLYRFRVDSVSDPRVRYPAVRSGVGSPAQYCDCSGANGRTDGREMISDHWTTMLYAAQFLVMLCTDHCAKQPYSAKGHQHHHHHHEENHPRRKMDDEQIDIALPNVEGRSARTSSTTTTTRTTTTASPTTTTAKIEPLVIFENFLLNLRQQESNEIDDRSRSSKEEDEDNVNRVKKSKGWYGQRRSMRNSKLSSLFV